MRFLINRNHVMNSPSFADMFERLLVPSIFRPWAEDLVERVQPEPRERVLDIGCGTGIVARLVRQRCGADARISGVDLNPEMIAVARRLEPSIDWHQANALELPFEDASFDVVLCQQALQFFPDRAAGVHEMRRVLTSGGRIGISTWRPLEENPLYATLNQLAQARFGSNVDRRFSFGDAQALRSVIADAGFRDIRIETVTRNDGLQDPDTFVAMNLNATVDLSTLEEKQRAQALAEFKTAARKAVSRFLVGEALVAPVSANVAVATA
jgi:ubiquinone/menaquinone biosynthesis C-methylase UbiE